MLSASPLSSQPPPYSMVDPTGLPTHEETQAATSEDKDAPTMVNGRVTVFSKGFTNVYQDVWAAFAFLIHLVTMICLPIYLYSIVDLSQADPRSILASILTEFKNIEFVALASVVVSSLVGAIFLISLIFYCMKSFPDTFIKVSIFAYLAIIGLFLFLTVLAGAIFPSILLGVLFFINSLFFWRARHKIPLTALVLRTTLGILELYPSMAVVSVCQLVLQFIYVSFAFFTFLLIVAAASQSLLTPGILMLYFSFSALSLFWTCQVLMNILHVTISGVFASFYLTGGKYSSPIGNCLGRALTFSFGSICFGSLIVAAIQTVRFLVRSLKDDNSVVGAIADCILGCIENLASYFNFFAYTELAIYGRSFVSSAKDCWSLIKRSGVELIVNDILAGVVLTLGMLVVTVGGSLYGKLLISFIFNQLTQSAPEVYIVITALVFLLSFAMLAEMIKSGINTSIVCFCEEPRGIQNSNPLLYEKYTEIVSGYHA